MVFKGVRVANLPPNYTLIYLKLTGRVFVAPKDNNLGRTNSNNY